MENRTFHVTADGFKSSGAPWYIRTKEIKRNLKVPKLRDKLKNISEKYMERLNVHSMSLARKLGTAAAAKADARVRRSLKRLHPPPPPRSGFDLGGLTIYL